MTTYREVPTKPLRFENEAAVLAYAKEVARHNLVGDVIDGPEDAAEFLRVRFAGLDREEFVAIYVSSSNTILGVETLGIGTLNQTTAFPREVAKGALRHNAAGVVVAHNHPQTGKAEPSDADIVNSIHLAKALELVDVRLLASFVVSGHDVKAVSKSDVARIEALREEVQEASKALPDFLKKAFGL